MSVATGHAKLRVASKELRIRWNSTQLAWRDENCRKFEENHLTPLLSRLRTAEAALGRMYTVMNQIHRDCE